MSPKYICKINKYSINVAYVQSYTAENSIMVDLHTEFAFPQSYTTMKKESLHPRREFSRLKILLRDRTNSIKSHFWAGLMATKRFFFAMDPSPSMMDH
jgi:hypothetical protein